MIFSVYLISAFLLLISAFIIFRVFVKRYYKRKGRLTFFSTSLEWLIFIFPIFIAGQCLIGTVILADSAVNAFVFIYGRCFESILIQGIDRTESDTGASMVLRASFFHDNGHDQFS